ncbi:hypothetical protein NDI37_18495 [Funiculus sociatus GB2-A5]|jgi:hypothetical protein|uniref:Uncharacterized protein n=1 Tax=Funiculus sociatus GB2-A5 TaxID=2933946 RepID=A0ABV0JUX2_9CYAN|nr:MULTISPECIES: hypothetical protein [unclassified Trichocoleus]
MVKRFHRIILTNACIAASFLLAKPTYASPFLAPLPELFLSADPSNLPARILDLPPGLRTEPILEEFDFDICKDIPLGVGIPGFQPGVHNSVVQNILGAPSGNLRGYWPNTRAIFYQLVPDEVSLGFLLDKASGMVRQTEAAFAQEVDHQVMLVTLNSMLGCQINDEIKQGLQQVKQRQSRKYSFSVKALKGVIERDRSDRVYIGIWQAGLH